MSVNIWNATEQKLEQVSGNVNINDSITSADSTWSSEKINDSLVDKVGVLDDLKTEEKSNLVGAINEVATLGGYKIRTGTVTVSVDGAGWFAIPTDVKNSKTKYFQLIATNQPYWLAHSMSNGYAYSFTNMAKVLNATISATYIAFDSID